MDIDALVNVAVARANVRMGTQVEWVRSQMGVRVHGAQWGRGKRKQPAWSAEELAFVAEHMGKMSYEEIGAALGRTAVAVKIAQVRRQLTAGSKQAGWITANGIAKLLGTDVHMVTNWQKFRQLPRTVMAGERRIRLTRMEDLKRWMVRPENWVCFRVERVGDPRLQRLVRLAQERWGDAWWRIGEVAVYHGVATGLVNLHVRKGWLRGNDYGNLWIRRSEALAHRFRKRGDDVRKWSARGDAFLLKARGEGKGWRDLARMMKLDEKTVAYRWGRLNRDLNPLQGAEAAGLKDGQDFGLGHLCPDGCD